jgi:hypothetical protein
VFIHISTSSFLSDVKCHNFHYMWGRRKWESRIRGNTTGASSNRNPKSHMVGYKFVLS